MSGEAVRLARKMGDREIRKALENAQAELARTKKALASLEAQRSDELARTKAALESLEARRVAEQREAKEALSRSNKAAIDLELRHADELAEARRAQLEDVAAYERQQLDMLRRQLHEASNERARLQHTYVLTRNPPMPAPATRSADSRSGETRNGETRNGETRNGETDNRETGNTETGNTESSLAGASPADLIDHLDTDLDRSPETNGGVFFVMGLVLLGIAAVTLSEGYFSGGLGLGAFGLLALIVGLLP